MDDIDGVESAAMSNEKTLIGEPSKSFDNSKKSTESMDSDFDKEIVEAAEVARAVEERIRHEL